MDHDKLTAALNYLLWTAPSYCQWADGGNAVGWVDGPTIAFRQELAVVFARQEGKGLPPLGATLILLSACRESWPESHGTLIRCVSELSSIERYMPEWIGEVLTALDAVAALPRELIESVDGKAELVDYVFDDRDTPRTAADLAGAVAHFLHSGSSARRMELSEPAVGDLWRELGTLRHCLRKFDPAAFERRLRTGIERPVEAAKVELPPGQRVRALLTTLLEDPELGGLARLARQLLAAVSLPRPLAEPDELPLGGVTDIANRGTLDRLLISELAHDDLTLAVRVATNEAMYLRREQPPLSPPLKRAIVLDSGVRMWGVPRVIATALGMAFCAAADKQLDIQSFRASGRRLAACDLTRREGIETHLAMLEPEAHLGAALADLARALADDELASDAVLITSEGALGDDQFCRELREARYEGWIAAVQRDGRVRLLSARRRALVPLREVQIDLESILAPTPTLQPPLVRDDPRDLPAYCRLARQPLRIPHELTLAKAWHVPSQGVLAIHKDYRLTLWENPKYGPRELGDTMPVGRVHWADTRPDQTTHHAVAGKLTKRGLAIVRVSFETMSASTTPLTLDFAEQPHCVAGDRVYVYVLSPRTVNVFTLEGQLVTSGPIPPDLVHLRHRYFKSSRDSAIHTLLCDGARVHFSQMASSSWQSAELLTVLEPLGSEQPLLLTGHGVLINLTTGERQRVVPERLGQITAITAIGRNDQRIAVRAERSVMSLLVYTEQQGSSPTGSPTAPIPERDVEPQLDSFLKRGVSLRRHFRSIGVTDEGYLAVLSRSDRQIVLTAQDRQLVLRDRNRSQTALAHSQKFHATSAPSGYLLEVATWENGSRAWLDSRGLLHLRSSDTNVPELTIVLHEGQVAGWSSDGRKFGNPYFLGPDHAGPDATPRIIIECLAPFVRGLQ